MFSESWAHYDWLSENVKKKKQGLQGYYSRKIIKELEHINMNIMNIYIYLKENVFMKFMIKAKEDYWRHL